ncbi:unnamed protein product [Spodoptera littoralis]|uniref:CHK kinase-like domain-containing protein n=1 Tax=Spodoptera littoralis TaxID=7109 RepID=A0A9P0HT41_SPOLI|nr:unnamed protein product [Spodoptera littoralis]CAH1634836.1 unnamed protein product [Spodoptera littoralis]
MTEYNFEGDFSNLSERQLEYINKVVLEQNLKVNKVVFNSFGQAGDNFGANVKRISIEGENGSMKMIIKIAAVDEIVQVLPKLVALQKAARVPEEEHLRYAKCYGSLDEAPNEVIMLEDLKESGHIMLDKYEPLQDDVVRNILKTFAIYHSLSHVLKNKEPATYKCFEIKLRDVWSVMSATPEYTNNFKGIDDATVSIVENETHKDIVKNRITNMFKLVLKLVKEENTKYSVIQHGDAWTNNILFKLVDGEVGPSTMIDYQGARRNNPVMDILYMIFNGTDYETRKNNFYNWLDYYHSELDKSLSYFSLKADVIYPRDQLDADVKKYSELIFGVVLFTSNILNRDVNETKEVIDNMEHSGLTELISSMANTKMKAESENRARKKIEGIIDSYTEFGFFDHFQIK